MEPIKGQVGGDRYKLMRKPIKGDLVLHFYNNDVMGTKETYLCGYSFVKEPYITTSELPPLAGKWKNQGYFIVLN
jgi:hypothetical protein